MKNRSIIDMIKSLRKPTNENSKVDIPRDLFKKCPGCSELIATDRLVESAYVCPRCDHHLTIDPITRLDLLLDSYKAIGGRFKFRNPIDFKNYKEDHKKTQDKIGVEEAIQSVHGKMLDVELVVLVMDNRFFMGSMGSYLGEEITRAFEYGAKKNLPVLIYSTSGGARMQEGIFSLMQMGKTAMAVKEFSETKNLYISCLTHPTTGGVSASFASLGDINIAEPKALIGFAGPRVIKETIKGELPDGFQTAEFLLEKGFLDDIIDRRYMREFIYKVLKIHGYGRGNFD